MPGQAVAIELFVYHTDKKQIIAGTYVCKYRVTANAGGIAQAAFA